MNLNRWENIKNSCKAFMQDKVVEQVLEHAVGAALTTGFILMSGCWLWVAGPAMEQSQLFYQEREGLEQRVAILKSVAMRDNYGAMELQLQQELESLERNVKKPDINVISKELVQLAETQLLQVAAIKLPDPASVKRHPDLPVEIYSLHMIVKGDYASLVGFVQKAEQQYTLRKISIAGHKDGSVRAEMDVVIHKLV